MKALAYQCTFLQLRDHYEIINLVSDAKPAHTTLALSGGEAAVEVPRRR
jgi:hypothetical protein